MNDTKFCLHCSLPFIAKWNKRLDPAYMDKDCCCKACELSHYKKEIKKAQQIFGKNRHGVMS